MILLTIPKSQRQSVKSLMSLPIEEMEQFVEAVVNAAPAASFNSLAEHIGSKLKNPILNLRGILNVIGTIGSIREEEEIKSDEMAEQLVAVAKGEGLLPENIDELLLKRNISKLLESVKAITLTRKARDLLSEHEHVYCADNSRVISDIRSIFPDGEIAAPLASVIVHMLKIAYHEGDTDRQFYVALDIEDVRLLRDLLDRAIAKEAKLKEAIKLSRVPYIGCDQEND